MAIDNQIARVNKREAYGYYDFDRTRIEKAILKCATNLGGFARFLHDEIDIHRILFRNLNDPEIASLLADDVILCLNSDRDNAIYFDPPNIELIQDLIEHVLLSRGLVELKSFYRIYRSGRTLIRKGELTEEQFLPTGMPPELLQSYEKSNENLQCSTISELNKINQTGSINEIIEKSLAVYRSVLEQVADSFLQKESARVLLVTGPSSSGKTTTKNILCDLLRKRGIKFKSLELDNYYWDARLQPGDAFGDRNFETPQSLRIDEINRDIQDLLEGKLVTPPFYNFTIGRRDGVIKPMKLEDDEILLLDCLYGMFPPITQSVDPAERFQVYVEAMCPIKLNGDIIPFTIVRMIRRMLRDWVHRDYDPQRTLEHWHYVRAGETTHIIPRIRVADAIINSSFPWELAVLKKALLEKNVLSSLPGPTYYFAWDRLDPAVRTKQMRLILESVDAVDFDLLDLSIIPADCLLREFIGGSKYEKGNIQAEQLFLPYPVESDAPWKSPKKQ